MNLTKQQHLAITHRGSNLLVAASAGSGKTEVLARRCLALLTDPRHPCRVDQLLVVTFTRAAAAELRVRIAGMLRAEAERAASPALRAHLRRQEALVEAADIGTIDAWCGRILREFYTQAGVDPAFRVLSPQDAALLRSQQLERLMEWVYTSDDELADATRRWITRHDRPSDDFLRRMILALSERREHLLEPDRRFALQLELCARPAEELRTRAAQRLAEALSEECRTQAEELDTLLAGVRDADVREALREYCDTLRGWSGRLDRLQARGAPAQTAPSVLCAVVTEIGEFSFPRQTRARQAGAEGADAGLLDEVRKGWLEARLKKPWGVETVESILEHAPECAALESLLLRLEQRFQEQLMQAKRAAGAFEFADVLRLTLDLLGEPSRGGPRRPTPVAAQLRSRYEHILIDEYQDTSPLQVEVLRLASRDEPGRTNRFMVGDIKQSIYSFRQAEPELFRELAEQLDAGRIEGRVLPLTDNFRSHADLVEGVNRLFAVLFDRRFGGTPYGERERLRARRAELPNPTLLDAPRIAIHLIEMQDAQGAGADTGDESGDELPLENIEREALLAASEIRGMIERGVQVPGRSGDGASVLRPLRLSDIVILLRAARGRAALLASALRREGIPCVAAARESIFESLEVGDVRSVLELLCSRRNELALAAYLRGPLVGLEAGELLAIRRAAPRGGFCEAVETFAAQAGADPLAERVRAALARLDGWREAARECELPALLRRILRESGLAFWARGRPAGEHRASMLAALERLAADFARLGRHDPAEFVQHLDALAEEELTPETTAAGEEDVVRILTIHAAKGLEFPVVFLLDSGSPFHRGGPGAGLYADEQEGLGLKFFDYPGRAELTSPAYLLLSRRQRQRELEEELRLLYVAATRARERLILIGCVGAGEWDMCRQRFEPPAPPPSLLTRLAARRMCDWIMMAAAASGLTRPQPAVSPSSSTSPGRPLAWLTVHAAREPHDTERGRRVVPALRLHGPAAPEETQDEPPDRWVQTAKRWLTTPLDCTLAALPAVLTVSALKERSFESGVSDRPRSLDHLPPALSRPRFLEAAGEEPRQLGTVVHRFLQHCDLARLERVADIESQVRALVNEGRLAASEATLVPVDDLAWFGASPEGRWLAAHAGECRREMPFVYALPVGAGERTIVRGVIDCLVLSPEGLVLFDYKTDAPRGADDWQRRLAVYRLQLQLYALAAESLLERRAVRAALIFLRERRVIEVAVDQGIAGEARIWIESLEC